MKNFLLDTNPNFGESKVTLGKDTYILTRVQDNGCILKVIENDIERDSTVFTKQDLKALFCLITVNDCQ